MAVSGSLNLKAYTIDVRAINNGRHDWLRRCYFFSASKANNRGSFEAG
jgi:hypothetical protein